MLVSPWPDQEGNKIQRQKILMFIYPIYHHNWRNISTINRVSQEEWTKLRESVPYVTIYRYNPKHLCPKLNGYGDKGARKVWSSCGSTFCVWFAWRNTHTLRIVRPCLQPTQRVPRCDCTCKVLGNPKDNYDMSASVFVVQFNGFMSLTS